MRKSINKTTVVIVLAIFLTLSVGYALFSDTITIEGTATAQGNFDITATCQLGLLEGTDPSQVDIYDEKGYQNDSCDVQDDKVIFSTDLLYPGAARHFTVKLENTGSIDALVNPSTINVKSSEKECIDGYNNTQKNGEIEDSECYTPDGSGDIFFYEYRGMSAIGESDGKFTFITAENGAELTSKYMYMKNGVPYIKLPPKTSVYLVYVADFQKLNDTDTLGNDFLVKGIFTYEYDFIQATE